MDLAALHFLHVLSEENHGAAQLLFRASPAR